ncbi:MAG: MFS transporter [Deltaproteobacteria bacterium]|nr:MFS transporter [Deltaproteobacteria bacterium]
MSNKNTPPLYLAWLIWSLGALLYLVGFFHRVAPAVMTAELMQDFNISAAGLGNLSAFYFYSYVAMQVPTGIMADIFGPRRLLAYGATIAGIGTAMFALAPDLFWANTGRLLIGGSVAVAFVGLLKFSTQWFPARYFSMVSGVALLFGILGAVSAGTPLRLLVDRYSWRSVILVSAIFLLAVGALVWIFMRDYPHEKGYQDFTAPETGPPQASFKVILGGILEVFRYPNTLLLVIIPGGVVGCVLTFSGLWGVPFLSTHRGLSTAQSAALTSTLMVAWAIGGPVFGWLSDRIGRRKPLYIAGAAVALTGWIGIIYGPDVPLWALLCLLVVTGFSSGVMIVSFAFAKESVPSRLSGTSSGITNTGVMAGAMLLQPAVGRILDARWEGAFSGSVRVYSLETFQYGFSPMIALAALSLVLLLFTRETYCRQKP